MAGGQVVAERIVFALALRLLGRNLLRRAANPLTIVGILVGSKTRIELPGEKLRRPDDSRAAVVSIRDWAQLPVCLTVCTSCVADVFLRLAP